MQPYQHGQNPQYILIKLHLDATYSPLFLTRRTRSQSTSVNNRSSASDDAAGGALVTLTLAAASSNRYAKTGETPLHPPQGHCVVWRSLVALWSNPVATPCTNARCSPMTSAIRRQTQAMSYMSTIMAAWCIDAASSAASGTSQRFS